MSKQPQQEVPKYHERQRLALCLKHTLNNLCQEPKFTKQDLDRLANSLTPPKFGIFSPHCFPILGNFDVNVLEAALLGIEKELAWLDARDTEFSRLDTDTCWAIVVNTTSSLSSFYSLLGTFGTGRHWFGLRRFGVSWYNLDSLLEAPAAVTDNDKVEAAQAAQLKEFLCTLLEADSKVQIFIVKEKPDSDH